MKVKRKLVGFRLFVADESREDNKQEEDKRKSEIADIVPKMVNQGRDGAERGAEDCGNMDIFVDYAIAAVSTTIKASTDIEEN